MTTRLHPKWLVASALLMGGWLWLVTPRSTTVFSTHLPRLQSHTVLAADKMQADRLRISQTYAVSPTVIAIEIAAPDRKSVV